MKEQSDCSFKLLYANLVFRQVPNWLPNFHHMAWVNLWLMVFRHLPRVPQYSVVENIMKFYRHDRDSNPDLCGEIQTCQPLHHRPTWKKECMYKLFYAGSESITVLNCHQWFRLNWFNQWTMLMILSYL